MSVYKEPLEWLKTTIESILNQTISDFEYIIIVDNPENNEAIDVIKNYAESDDRIKMYINEQNMGLVKSLNRGLQYCTGEYIARMDADDIAHNDRFEKQLEYIEKTGYDMIGSDFNVFHDDVIERTGKGAYTPEVCNKILKYESCVLHPSWFVRKDVYDKLDGYRDIDSCEDLDFLIRASLGGFKIGNAPHVLIEYRNNPKSICHLKTFKQKATTSLMTKRMREGKVMDMEEYHAYLESDECKKYIKKAERVAKFENYYYDTKSSALVKYGAVCILLTLPIFRFKKFVRFYVRRCKKNEN